MREPVIPAKLNKLLIKEAFEPFSCDHSCLSSESFICTLLITLIYLRTRKELYLWWQRKSTLFDLDWLFQRSCQTFIFHHFIKDMPAICGLYKISLIKLKMSHHSPPSVEQRSFGLNYLRFPVRNLFFVPDGISGWTVQSLAERASSSCSAAKILKLSIPTNAGFANSGRKATLQIVKNLHLTSQKATYYILS